MTHPTTPDQGDERIRDCFNCIDGTKPPAACRRCTACIDDDARPNWFPKDGAEREYRSWLPILSAAQPVAPDGYALISVDALRAWGKLDEVTAACKYPIAAPQPSQGAEEALALSLKGWPFAGTHKNEVTGFASQQREPQEAAEPMIGEWRLLPAQVPTIAMMDAGHEKLCEIIENRRGFASDVYLAMVNACAHQSHVADEQAIMVMVYEYAKISEGFDAAEGEQRTKQRKAMATKAAEIRAALSAPQEAAERPANFTELWELYSRVGDAHENHGRNHEKTMEARATFHAALMRALSAPQEAGKAESQDAWPDYIAGIIETYVKQNRTDEDREKGIAGIIRRRMYLAPKEAGKVEAVAEAVRICETLDRACNEGPKCLGCPDGPKPHPSPQALNYDSLFRMIRAFGYTTRDQTHDIVEAILAAAGGSEK